MAQVMGEEGGGAGQGKYLNGVKLCIKYNINVIQICQFLYSVVMT